LPRPVLAREPVVGVAVVRRGESELVEEREGVLFTELDDGEDVRNLVGRLGEESGEMTVNDALDARASDDALVDASVSILEVTRESELHLLLVLLVQELDESRHAAEYPACGTTRDQIESSLAVAEKVCETRVHASRVETISSSAGESCFRIPSTISGGMAGSGMTVRGYRVNKNFSLLCCSWRAHRKRANEIAVLWKEGEKRVERSKVKAEERLRCRGARKMRKIVQPCSSLSQL
jgi:hypothetical protein